MPAAKCCEELIAVTEKEWSKLSDLVERVDGATAVIKHKGVSIKDLLAHRAHWIKLYLGWYRDGLAGQKVYFPARGYKWNQLNEYNAAVRKQQAGLEWDSARALLEDRHAGLMSFFWARSEAELYGGPMKGANNNWTPGRWAEAAGASHYRSASKFIRKCLRETV